MGVRVLVWTCGLTLMTIGLSALAGVAGAGSRIATTLQDYFQPGSQPNGGAVYEVFRSSNSCRTCHKEDAGRDLPIYAPWQGSMMAQSARDPLFHACLAIANQDAAFVGDLCIRCHSPSGWISGRSEPTDGSALTAPDRDGVSCSVCHRAVDPVYKTGVSPLIDQTILSQINPLPINPGGGNYVLDTADMRRGPYADPASPGHGWLASPFHRTAELCATCHDVSNPAYRRQPDDTYVLTPHGEAHPTADKYDMFPLERTYSEWLHSDFANGGVNTQGRFGGTLGMVSTCQDCHMPTVTDKGCYLDGVPVRSDLKSHDFAGGNAWVQDMVLNLYPNDSLVPELLAEGKQRSISMLQRACTLQVHQVGNYLNVRVINETGHKLPSGYPEGRRMWINAQMFDESLAMIAERGRYDGLSAELTTSDTKVYEAVLGVDAVVAALTGIPPGKGFHFALNNVMVKDNRIPPRGFTNAAFWMVQAAPVGATYGDGQFWDDTRVRLVNGAVSATVSIHYQTSSREYIEFLRSENRTNTAGEVLYVQWQLTGMSAPVLVATATVPLDPFADGDYNGDWKVNLMDYAILHWSCATAPGIIYTYSPCATFDFDEDGDIDLRDVGEIQLSFAP